MASVRRWAPGSWLLIALAGIAGAQDTNFSSGPQYLITTESTRFLHPISTPGLSLGEGVPSAVSATQAEGELVQTPAAASPTHTFLSTVYWGEHKNSEIVERRLETPTTTPSETALYMQAVENAAAPISEAAAEVAAGSSIVEITSVQRPANLSPIFFDPGVTGRAGPQSLLNLDYCLPLGETAAFWKAHKGHAVHLYTNRDIQRLHGG